MPSNGLTDRYEMEFEFRKKLVHPQLPILEEFFFTQEHLNVISAYPNAKPLLNIILGDANEKGLPIHHRFPDNVAHVIEWILQLGSALNVLHSQKPFPIIHRNLNPSTLLIGDTGLHLLNFGIPSSILRAENIFDRFDAPYNFSAPEITGLENFSLQSDIFSFGRIIDFLLTGFIPSSRNENPLCLTNSIDLGKDNRIKLLTKIVEVCCQQSRIKRIATIKQALDPLWSLLSLQKQADQPMTICRCGQPNRSSSRFCVCCSRLLHNDEPRMRNNEEVIPPIPIEWQNANENQVVKNYNDKKVSKFEHYRLHSILNKVQSDPGFDSLSCLDSLPFVDKLPHQKAAALTVLKDMRGRALLADEVGLGKTIEAGIILKELFERKLIESVLILCPRQLLRQWQLELYSKFDELFLVMGRDVDSSLAWYSSRLIAPYQILEEKFHIEELLLQHYDLVILDEVHFLNDERNWRTLRTVRNLRKKYFLLLSATPMHNDLKELYNIITLLRPGHLPEWEAFSDKYIDENSATGTKNTSELKKLLHQVMIRHTRRDVAKDYPFPIRRAFRQELTLTQKDSEFYNDFRMFYQKKLRNINNRRMMYTMGEIVERLSSSPAAFREAIHNYRWQIIRSWETDFLQI
ncbi:MAG: SNF2-related protein [Anaerolineae bacterium]